MAWTSPLTWTAGAVLTAAQLNTHVRDNLLETAPAKATTAGRLFVSTGANAIAERVPSTSSVSTSQSTTSTSPADLATVGPAVTVTTGVRAIHMVSVAVSNNNNGVYVYCAAAVSGATTIAADADSSARVAFLRTAAVNQESTASRVYMETGLTAGSNTFTVKYWGSAGTSSYYSRSITVLPL